MLRVSEIAAKNNSGESAHVLNYELKRSKGEMEWQKD
jgi:hypothetical protein